MIKSLILVAVLFWASSFVAIRAALFEYNPIDIAFLRFLISSSALILITLSQRIRFPNREDYSRLALLGLVLFINHIALNYGTRTLTAGETTLIVSTSQLFQVLLAGALLSDAKGHFDGPSRFDHLGPSPQTNCQRFCLSRRPGYRGVRFPGVFLPPLEVHRGIQTDPE